GRAGLLRLSRGPDQCPRALGLPLPPHRPLAAHASLAQPEGRNDVGADDQAPGSLAPTTPHHPSLAQPPLCRSSPEVGARCGNAARRDLCGGCVVTCIPTAIGTEKRRREARKARVHSYLLAVFPVSSWSRIEPPVC